MALTRCSICNHPKLAAIDETIAAGGKLIATAVAFEVSKSALHRHLHRCVWCSSANTTHLLVPSPRPAPTTIAAKGEARIHLSDALLDAMRPFEPAEGDIAEALETKLRHLNAIYSYALSRGVAKDDVASILRAGRAMQRLFELDLSTAPQRLRCRAEQLIDPTMQMLAEILGSARPMPNPNGELEIATRCNDAPAIDQATLVGARHYA